MSFTSNKVKYLSIRRKMSFRFNQVTGKRSTVKRRKSINILITASERKNSFSNFKAKPSLYIHTHTQHTQTRCPAYPLCPSPQCLCRNLCTLCMFYDFHLVFSFIFRLNFFFLIYPRKKIIMEAT